MSPTAADKVTDPPLSNAKVVSMRDVYAEVRRRCCALASRRSAATKKSTSSHTTVPGIHRNRVIRICLCLRRQRRRRPKELDLRIERVVQRLHQESAVRILVQRLLALRDRIVDDLQIVIEHG